MATDKIRKFIQYNHHGAVVWTQEHLKGLHRTHCLCYSCANFFPGQPNNCPIAERLFAVCVEENVVTPVWECPKFVFSQAVADRFLPQPQGV